MHMVMLSVELRQFGLKVETDVREYVAQIVNHLFGEYAASVFGDKDQMHVHLENTVPAMSNIVVVFHRPSIIEA